MSSFPAVWRFCKQVIELAAWHDMVSETDFTTGCMYACIHVCVCIYKYSVYIFVSINVLTHFADGQIVNVYTHASIHPHIHAYIHAYMHAYILVRTYLHTFAHASNKLNLVRGARSGPIPKFAKPRQAHELHSFFVEGILPQLHETAFVELELGLCSCQRRWSWSRRAALQCSELEIRSMPRSWGHADM